MDIPECIKYAVCVVIALLAIGLFRRQRVYNPNDYNLNDYELLKKPLIESGGAVFKDSDNKLRLRYVKLIERYFDGREYWLVDSPDDGYFPNDCDGLVDSVSKRDHYRLRRNIFSYRMKGDRGRRRTPWTEMPFEIELYQIATEKFKEALAKRGLLQVKTGKK